MSINLKRDANCSSIRVAVFGRCTVPAKVFGFQRDRVTKGTPQVKSIVFFGFKGPVGAHAPGALEGFQCREVKAEVNKGFTMMEGIDAGNIKIIRKEAL
jgi:hypothetical protein